MVDLGECLIGRWRHSREEDTPDVQVYRPADYRFPLTRGREGFDFLPGGDLIYIGIGPGDGTEESNGRWTIEAPNRVRIEVDNARIEPFSLEVVSCDGQTLKVKR